MKAIAVILAVLCLSLSANAEEVVDVNEGSVTVSAEVPPAPSRIPDLSAGVIVIDIPFYWNSLVEGLTVLLGILWKAIFIYGIGWIVRKLASKERAKEVMDSVSIGVDHAWETMGREIKRAAADRKLTADERQKLQNVAFEHSKSILSNAGKKLLEGYSWSTIVSMVSNAVRKRKALAGMSPSGGTNGASNPTP